MGSFFVTGLMAMPHGDVLSFFGDSTLREYVLGSAVVGSYIGGFYWTRVMMNQLQRVAVVNLKAWIDRTN